MKNRIYLDWNGSAPMLDEAREALIKATEHFGNPSSIHREGRKARALIENSRATVAGFMGCASPEVVFTSGGSEANTLAVGDILARGGPVAAIESMHPSLNMALEKAEAEGNGVEIQWLGINEGGVIDPEAIGAVDAIVGDVANSETGTVQPFEKMGELALDRGIALHLDAVQAWGRMALNVTQMGAATVSLSGHKIGAPKGVGALYVREGTKLSYVTSYGKHERGLRGGTENMIGIAALAAACEVRGKNLVKFTAHMERLTAMIREGLSAFTPRALVNSPSSPARVLANTVNFSVEGVQADLLVQAMDLEGVAMSAGSACRSGVVEPAKVIEAMGLEPWRALSAVRVSVGPSTTEDEVTDFLARLHEVAGRLVAKK
jgi:cysteine desulfurase